MRGEMQNELFSFISRSHLENLKDEEKGDGKQRESRPQSDPDFFPVVQLKALFV